MVEGAMSHSFVATMRKDPNQTYIQVLQNTRQTLAQNYKQIPQLSVGGLYDLDQKVAVSTSLSFIIARRLAGLMKYSFNTVLRLPVVVLVERIAETSNNE